LFLPNTTFVWLYLELLQNKTGIKNSNICFYRILFLKIVLFLLISFIILVLFSPGLIIALCYRAENFITFRAFQNFSNFAPNHRKILLAMNEEVSMLIDMTKESMQGALEHLERELAHIRAGKANPRMLDSVHVDYYGAMTPIMQVSSITTPDAKTIVIQPWEKNMIAPIEKAILNANLGFNPDNNGEIIRIFIPPLTEERRKLLIKDVNKEGEAAKVSVRSARKEANDQLKKMLKDGLSEDEEKNATEKVQTMTDEYNKKVDDRVVRKHDEIMTI
jgi:ribosome recycling factor